MHAMQDPVDAQYLGEVINAGEKAPIV